MAAVKVLSVFFLCIIVGMGVIVFLRYLLMGNGTKRIHVLLVSISHVLISGITVQGIVQERVTSPIILGLLCICYFLSCISLMALSK